MHTSDGTGVGKARAEPPTEPDASLAKRSIVAVGLTILAILIGGVLAVPVLLGGSSGVTQFVGLITMSGAGFLLAAVLFLSATDAGGSYVGAALPSSNALPTVGGWAVGLAAFAFAAVAAVNTAGVSTLPAYSADAPIDPATSFLLLIPLSIAVVAPAEELFFRGVLQTYLGGATSARGAILGAGILFALVHVPNYVLLPSVAAAAIMTGIIFVVGLGFGLAYERTDSLAVPIGVHAGYNTLMMLGWYGLVTYGVVSF